MNSPVRIETLVCGYPEERECVCVGGGEGREGGWVGERSRRRREESVRVGGGAGGRGCGWGGVETGDRMCVWGGGEEETEEPVSVRVEHKDTQRHTKTPTIL